jgi:hypothetical protein
LTGAEQLGFEHGLSLNSGSRKSVSLSSSYPAWRGGNITGMIVVNPRKAKRVLT